MFRVAAVMMMPPVYGAESVTSLQDSLRPRWLPELNRTASKPADNAVKRLMQTSTRPEHSGMTVNTSAPGTTADSRRASTEHRTSIGGQSARSNTSRDVMTSPEVASDDDDRTLIEKTLPQLKPPQSSGNHSRQRGYVFDSAGFQKDYYRRR